MHHAMAAAGADLRLKWSQIGPSGTTRACSQRRRPSSPARRSAPPPPPPRSVQRPRLRSSCSCRAGPRSIRPPHHTTPGARQVPVTTSPSYLAARWEKLCWNIPFNGLAVPHRPAIEDKRPSRGSFVPSPTRRARCLPPAGRVDTGGPATLS